MSEMLTPRERIALAADLPLEHALALYQSIQAYVGYVKIGLSLFIEHGPQAVHAFAKLGGKVFLDLKLHDIPNTVENAAIHAAALGIDLLTVHAQGGQAMLEAAVTGVRRGAAEKNKRLPKILAVTVLTSLDDDAIRSTGYRSSTGELVAQLTDLAERSGVDGIVCSAWEAEAVRKRSTQLFICTPGIRLASGEHGDQVRVETPDFAVRHGSDLLVVGRALYGSAQPVEAAKALAASVSSALPQA